MKNRDLQILLQSPLFKGIEAEDLEHMLSRVRYGITVHSRNRLVASRGDEVRVLWVVISGMLRAEMADFSGRTMQVEMIAPPRPVAPGFIFGTRHYFPVDVYVQEAVRLLSLPRPGLMALFRMDERILENFLNMVSSRAQFLADRIWFMSFKTIRQKLAQYLVRTGSQQTVPLRMDRSIQELSEYFGVTRPALSRVLAEFERLGILRRRGRKIEFLDMDQLVHMSE